MHADAFFRMGRTHLVCEDYALAGDVGGAPYAMLSDGCSSSPHTDFGARFIVRAALARLQRLREGTLPKFEIIDEAYSLARAAGLPKTSVDATLLVATLDASREDILTYQAGDGVVAARRRTGELEYYVTEYTESMPYYLSYILSPRARADFWAVEQEMRVWSNTLPKETPYVVGTPSVGFRRFAVSEYDLVALLSDGAQSFHSGPDHIAVAEVLTRLLSFQGMAGEFVKRRGRWFVEKECPVLGWKHDDDLAFAAIYCGAAP